MIDLYRRFIPPYGKTVALIIFLLFVQALAQLYLPSLNADLINNGVTKGDTGYIMRTGAIMLLVSLIFGVVAVIGVYFSARTAMAIGRDIRGSLFRQVQSFSLREVNEFGAPTLITRNTNDVQQVQMMTVMAFTIMISAPLMLIGGVIMAIGQDVVLSGLLVLIIPIMVLVIGLLMRRAIPLFRLMQVKIDADVSTLHFAISGSAAMPSELFERFEKATGVTILEGYGMTEATCLISINPPHGERKIGSVGLPFPYSDVRILHCDASSSSAGLL